MKTLAFNFDNPSSKDKAVKEVVKNLERYGLKVIASEFDAKTTKRAGVSFRYLNLTFGDGQKAALGIKETGDVFEIKINGKAVPITNQDDHADALKELADQVDRRRAAFQRAMARAQVPIPPSVRTSRTVTLLKLTERRDALQEVVKMKEEELTSLTAPVD
jgi:hypothetical protein